MGSPADNHMIDFTPHLLKACKEQRARIAELEAALRECIEWAGSDCEHEACKGVIAIASKFVQLDDH